MKLENLAAFQQRFEEVESATTREHTLIPEIDVEAELELNEITPKFFRILNNLNLLALKTCRLYL